MTRDVARHIAERVNGSVEAIAEALMNATGTAPVGEVCESCGRSDGTHIKGMHQDPETIIDAIAIADERIRHANAPGLGAHIERIPPQREYESSDPK